MEFKHPPRGIATEAPANYEGLDFQTQALQQSKIDLSWDVDEPDRVKTLKRKFNADQVGAFDLMLLYFLLKIKIKLKVLFNLQSCNIHIYNTDLFVFC